MRRARARVCLTLTKNVTVCPVSRVSMRLSIFEAETFCVVLLKSHNRKLKAVRIVLLNLLCFRACVFFFGSLNVCARYLCIQCYAMNSSSSSFFELLFFAFSYNRWQNSVSFVKVNSFE